MAHQLKYYKEIDSHGHLWRVEILQETEDTLTPMEIGPVLQGLRLVVQGDQADVDTPIVKTSLEMTFVDAPDLEEERKCGYWEEFYTSSATEYQVRLYKDGQIEWTGYVTPDSFSEDLRYRGSVSIIARDNLGHLQDFNYDKSGNDDGLISLADIIASAKTKVSFAMDIHTDDSYQHIWPKSSDDVNDGNLYTSALFNASAFANENWWNVLHDTLYSCGVIMRYIGRNKYVVTPIRNIGLADYNMWTEVPRKEASFVSFGRRSLAPAAKAIKDDVAFDIQDNIGHYMLNIDDYGDKSTYKFMPMPQVSSDYISMPIHSIVSGGWDVRDAEHTLFLNANAYIAKPEYRYGHGGNVLDTNNVYLAANVEYGDWDDRTAAFSQRIKAGKYKVSFNIFGIIALYDGNTSVGYIDSNAHLDTLKLLIQFHGNDGSLWSFKHIYGTYDYEWVKENISDGIPISGDIPFVYESREIDAPVEGRLVVTFSRIEAWDSVDKVSEGMYLGIKDVQLKVIDNNDKPIMDKLRITTEYSDKNNVMIVRSPKFAPNSSEIVSARVVQNGIYVMASDGWPMGSEKWSWHKNDTTLPLAVLTHNEVLAYYARPMNVLTGELVTSDPTFDCIYIWNGKKHLLTSGSFNIITGRMENVTLREFLRYDHMWESWAEIEDYNLDNRGGEVEIRLHTNIKVASDIWGDSLPSWLTPVGHRKISTGLYKLDARVMANGTGETRMAYIQLDTALIRITQQG